jgi:hypothetical protein
MSPPLPYSAILFVPFILLAFLLQLQAVEEKRFDRINRKKTATQAFALFCHPVSPVHPVQFFRHC